MSVSLLNTTRLLLRPFAESDLDSFAHIVGDPDEMALVGDSRPLTRERAQKWLLDAIRRSELGEPSTYAVVLKATDDLIGYGGFSYRHDAPDELEITYGLAKKTWRQGLGRELARALVDLGFTRFHRPRLWATIDPMNAASIKIVERLGMAAVEDRTDEDGLPERLYLLERGQAPDAASVKAKTGMHESGRPMIVFPRFKPTVVSVEEVERLIRAAKDQLGKDLDVIRVCLEPGQTPERTLLEQLGFRLDGIEYGISIDNLSTLRNEKRHLLPEGFRIAAMDFDRDIEAVEALEKSVHAADTSTRVNFDTPEAIAGMRGYYQKACKGNGVFLLMHGEIVAGLVGFMPDQTRQNATHISSVSIDLESQGKGLLLPFILSAHRQSRFAQSTMLTGVTSTAKLLAAAKRYSCDMLGISLSRIGV